MLKVLHIIGLVGAGKSTFIHRYLNEFPAFDIQKIYQRSGFSPADLHENHEAYERFIDALKYSVEKFTALVQGAEWIVVESSGINSALNQILMDYQVYTILITSKFPQTIYDERPYAKSLNDVIRTSIKEKIVPYDCIFDWRSDSWVRAPNKEVSSFFPGIGIAKKS